jgi:hypothetical protein
MWKHAPSQIGPSQIGPKSIWPRVKSAPVKIIEELKMSSKYSYVLYQ